MTREKALQVTQEYLNAIVLGDLIITVASIEFPATRVSEALEVPLDAILAEHSKRLISELSAYKAVLQNAIKGQLPQVAEEWSEVIDAD